MLLFDDARIPYWLYEEREPLSIRYEVNSNGFIWNRNLSKIFTRSLHDNQTLRNEIETTRSSWEGVMFTCVLYRERYVLNKSITQTPQAIQNETLLKKLSEKIEERLRERLSLVTYLFDRNIIQQTSQFYAFLCAWLLKQVDPDRKGLPLPKDPPAGKELDGLFFMPCRNLTKLL